MRKYVIGIIIGALLMSSGQALAGSISKIGKKVQGEYAIKVDGVTLDAKALAIDGQTTTPNRALADAVGYDVAFVDKEVIFTKKVTEIEITEPVKPLSPVETNVPTTSQTRTKEDINGHIRALNSSIESYEYLLKITERSEEDVTKINQEIEAMKLQIAELEAEKAALEAQQ